MAKRKYTDEERKHRNVLSTMKWKNKHPVEVNEHKKKNYAQSRVNAVNKRNLWTLKEIDEILTSPLSDRELSEKLGRSVQAIQVKRTKCKNSNYIEE